MEIFHKHPLMLIEQLEVYLQKQEVCSGCEKLVRGPGYICYQCEFYLHQSCSAIPQKIQSPLHPSHSLVLLITHEADICCYACGKLCNKCFVYHCSNCNFNLDIQCASQWQTNANDCRQHSFGPILQPIQFTCEACGEECKDKAHLCGTCQLLVDPECARRPRTIKTIIHDHKLRLIYSSHQVEKPDDICKLCRQTVNSKYAAYYCQDCSYVAHLKCASLIEEKINWPLLNLDEEIIGTWGKTEIFRFYHKHKLFLVDEDIGELRYNKLCDGCMLLISAPFYRCVQCDFFLHERCAKLQKIQRHRLHQHLLTLVSNAPSKDGVFKCNACHCYRHGFFYRCDECNYNLDIQCFTTPETLTHKGHQHTLSIPTSSNEKCSACGFQSSNCSFFCTHSNCKFTLCFKCATLPLVARHSNDTHDLNLTYSTVEDDFEEYYCLICEEKRDRNHWFYYCKKCDFPCHPNCIVDKYRYIKFGKTYKDEVHPHPLTIVQKTRRSSPCDSCGKPFDGVALECTQCKINIHRGLFILK